MQSFVERVGKETEGAAIKGVSHHAWLWNTAYLKSQGTANTLGHSSTSFVDFLPVIVPLWWLEAIACTLERKLCLSLHWSVEGPEEPTDNRQAGDHRYKLSPGDAGCPVSAVFCLLCRDSWRADHLSQWLFELKGVATHKLRITDLEALAPLLILSQGPWEGFDLSS